MSASIKIKKHLSANLVKMRRIYDVVVITASMARCEVHNTVAATNRLELLGVTLATGVTRGL